VMAFYVQRGWLEGWDKERHRCETLEEAYALAEQFDYPEGRLVKIEDEHGHDLHFYGTTFEEMKADTERRTKKGTAPSESVQQPSGIKAEKSQAKRRRRLPARTANGAVATGIQNRLHRSAGDTMVNREKLLAWLENEIKREDWLYECADTYGEAHRRSLAAYQNALEKLKDSSPEELVVWLTAGIERLKPIVEKLTNTREWWGNEDRWENDSLERILGYIKTL
jgi:hypothetical protein